VNRRLTLGVLVSAVLVSADTFGPRVAAQAPATRPASLATPRLTNAQFVTTSGGDDFGATVRGLASRRRSPGWIGWAVPMVRTAERSCCGGNGGSWDKDGRCGCQLEQEKQRSTHERSDRPVSLESGGTLFVFLRANAGTIQKIRTFSDDCQIDGSGMPVEWLVDVRPTASVAFLMDVITRDSATPDADDADEDIGHQAVGAIALIDGVDAERALVRLLDPARSVTLRKQVTFWLGSARGRVGLETLDRVLDTDPSEEVRDAAVFGLFVSRESGAVTRLIEAAKTDASGHVRGQALFWLAQKASAEAGRAITDAIERDPETEVKKKAVFALSQLPASEGVPLLIRVAETNRNPVVRKQAMFWLGQSNDDRAIAFFERVLR
jgi:hypothetical protein